MKSARLVLGALGLLAAATALAAASTVSAAAEEKPLTLAAVPHLVKRAEPARPAPSLPERKPLKGPAPGETARKLILADPHYKLLSAPTVPTLITDDTHGWSLGDPTKQYVYTEVSAMKNVGGADIEVELGSIDEGANFQSFEFYNFSASKPTATFHQWVGLVPGQQYIVEVALNDARCPGPGGELDVASRASGSQTIPIVDKGGLAHVMFFYTYQPVPGLDTDDIAFTMKPNEECSTLFVNSIAYVPFTPAN